MTAPRVNIYGFPHKGLKNGLSQLWLEAGKADVSNEESVERLKALSEQLTLLLELHQQAEDEFVLPALEARAPGTTSHNAAEHDRLHQIVIDIQKQTQALNSGDAMAAVNQLFTTIGQFISDYIRHMDEEEQDMNQVIWEHFTDEEILGWQGQIMGKLTPDQKMMWFRFIVPALNPMERQIMLGGVRQNVPAAVYQGILDMLSQHMTQDELLPLAG